MRTTKGVLLSMLIACMAGSLAAVRTTNRYFPQLERPETYYLPKSGNITANVFFSDAAASFKQDDTRVGIPELWGTYNIKDVISSRKTVVESTGGSFTNPFASNASLVGLIDKDIRFNVGGKLRSRGVGLQYEQRLWIKHMNIGAYVPFMEVTATQDFSLNPGKSTPAIQSTLESLPDAVDAVRRQLHDDIGLAPGDWKRSGLGDIELHLRWLKEWEYIWSMRTVRLALQAGVLAPIGKKRENNNPVSVPFGSNGHNAVFFDIMPEFELKQDWRVGLMFGWLKQYSHRQHSRIPVGSEPLPFSSLTGNTEVFPARTWKFSLYFTLENLFDGLHLQARHTYLKHREDLILDRRDTAVKIAGHKSVSSQLDTLLPLTEWHAHYFTLQLNYHTKDAQKNWWGTPNLYLTYDFPFEWFGGRRAAKMHTLTFGLELHF